MFEQHIHVLHRDSRGINIFFNTKVRIYVLRLDSQDKLSSQDWLHPNFLPTLLQTFNFTSLYITLHDITLHQIALNYVKLHYIRLHYISADYVQTFCQRSSKPLIFILHYNTWHYITSDTITLCEITLHPISLHFSWLHSKLFANTSQNLWFSLGPSFWQSIWDQRIWNHHI